MQIVYATEDEPLQWVLQLHGKFFPDGASWSSSGGSQHYIKVKLLSDATSSGAPAHDDSVADEALNCSTPVGQNNWSADW